MANLAHDLPYALEVARQLHDARKPLALIDILLRWDAIDVPLFIRHDQPSFHQIRQLQEHLTFFERLGAIRIQLGADQAFLPRRRQRKCPFHHEICLPTRENAEHHDLALHELATLVCGRLGESNVLSCPTFLVDLLDPWPRDMTLPPKGHSRRDALPDALRYYVLQRDGFRCQLCGASPQNTEECTLHGGHKQSRAHGGTDDPENLLTLCNVCNQGMGLQDL